MALPRGERTDDGGTWLPIGIDHTALQPFGLRLGAGEHLLVAGTPASGRTTALRRISISWREACPDGNVWNAVDVAELASSLVGAVIGAPHLVVIDDADHVTDESGDLARLIALGRPDVSVIAAIRPDLARGRFGHWTAGLARRRSGIILAAAGADADLVGVVEALRSPVDPRPGLAWVVHEGQTSLVQIATAG